MIYTGPRGAVGSASDRRAEVPGSIPGPATYFRFLISLIQEGQLSVAWRKYVHEV